MSNNNPHVGYVIVTIDKRTINGIENFRAIDVEWESVATAPVQSSFAPPLSPGFVLATVQLNDESDLASEHDPTSSFRVFVPIREHQRIETLSILITTDISSIGSIELEELTALEEPWFRNIPADVLPTLVGEGESSGPERPWASRSGSVLARHGLTRDQMVTAQGLRVLEQRTDAAGGPTWYFIGPRDMDEKGHPGSPFGGRVRDLKMTNDAAGKWRVYAAAADGGVWYRHEDDLIWQALGDYSRSASPPEDSNILSTGAIGVQFGTDPTGSDDIVVVGTGEPTGGARIGGVGIRVSENGGRTWKLLNGVTTNDAVGLNGHNSYSVEPDPQELNTFFIATTSGVWKLTKATAGWRLARFVPTPVPAAVTAVGISDRTRTTDLVTYIDSAGDTQLVAAFDPPAGSSRVVQFPAADPTAPTRLTGALTGRVSIAANIDGTEIWALDQNADIYRFHAATGTLIKATNGPGTGANGLWAAGGSDYAQGIAVASNGAQVAVLVCGIIRTTGGFHHGAVFQSVVTPAANGAVDYAHSMAAPGVDRFVGTGTHADCHRIVLDADNVAWVGNDGGVHKGSQSVFTVNTTFSSINQGLATAMFNYIDHDDDDATHLVGGTQDNGIIDIQRGTSRIVQHGDGGGIVVEPTTRKGLAEYINAKLFHRANGNAEYKFRGSEADWPLQYGPHDIVKTATYWGFGTPDVKGTHPLGATKYDFYNRLNRFTLRGTEHALFGSRDLWYRTFQQSAYWVEVPMGFAGNNQIIDTAAVGDHVYVLTTGGDVREVDFSTTPPQVAGLSITLPAGDRRFTAIGVIPGATRASDELIFGRADETGTPGVTPASSAIVTHARSSGTTTTIDLPSRVGVLCLAIDPSDPNDPKVYAGTAIGVFLGLRQQGSGWAFSAHWHGLPEATVLDLKYHTKTKKTRAALHGRGVWEVVAKSTRSFAGADLHGIYTRQWNGDEGFRDPNIVLGPSPAHVGPGPGDLHVIRHRMGPPAKVAPPFAHKAKFAWKLKHADVETWHNALIERGYSLSAAKQADKMRFTGESRKLAEAFQTDYDLSPDGDVGPITWARALADPPTRPALGIDHVLGGLRSDIDQATGNHMIDAVPPTPGENTVVLQVSALTAQLADNLLVDATLIAAPKAHAATLPDNWWVEAQKDVANTPDWVAGTEWSFLGTGSRGRASTTTRLAYGHSINLTWDTTLAEMLDATGNPVAIATGDEMVLVAIVGASSATIGGAIPLDVHLPAGWSNAQRRNLDRVLTVHPRVVAIAVVCG